MRTFSCVSFSVAAIAMLGIFTIAAARPEVGTGPAPTGRLSDCVPGVAHDLSQVTVEQFDQGFWATPCVFLARSPAEWDQIMSAMQASGELILTPPPPAPDIDWRKQSVIVASLGELNTNGYSIDVLSVRRVQATALVALKIHLPANDLVSPTLTSPYHMVAIARAGLKNVEVCTRSFVYGTGTSPVPSRNQPALHFESIQPPLGNDDPPVVPETWGSLKARY